MSMTESCTTTYCKNLDVTQSLEYDMGLLRRTLFVLNQNAAPPATTEADLSTRPLHSMALI